MQTVLLEAAQYLTGRQSVGRPRQVALKRAISTVYDALFRALALCPRIRWLPQPGEEILLGNRHTGLLNAVASRNNA